MFPNKNNDSQVGIFFNNLKDEKLCVMHVKGTFFST